MTANMDDKLNITVFSFINECPNTLQQQEAFLIINHQDNSFAAVPATNVNDAFDKYEQNDDWDMLCAYISTLFCLSEVRSLDTLPVKVEDMHRDHIAMQYVISRANFLKGAEMYRVSQDEQDIPPTVH